VKNVRVKVCFRYTLATATLGISATYFRLG